MRVLLTAIVAAMAVSLVGGFLAYYGSSLFQETLGPVPLPGQASAGDLEAATEGGVQLPEGDPEMGREAFIQMKCLQCHIVMGEGGEDEENVGPDLSDIGLIQPPEYLAESIIDPNALIVTGEGYAGEDGLSKMPEYHDTITLRQLID
ncbi:MAG: c-type cytochrome, partial [Dehalococcoidia bacterium]